MPDNRPGEASERQLRQACEALDGRLRAGQHCFAETFLAAFPLLAAHEDWAVELIYTEFAVREELGQRPTPQEYFARFPHWERRLRRQFQVHEALREGLAGAGEAPLPPPEDGRPTWLGAYELVAEVARGGCGVVYRAWQHGLDREVAVKVLRPELATRLRARQRFGQEARVMAGLRHPHIMPVHDIGESQGRVFFSMDFAAGSLAGPLDAAAAAGLLAAVARAVHFAHVRGVIHCDLKPSNVLLDAQGFPLVSDFGLAHVLEAARPDGPGELVGTPLYMAPEQLAGDGTPLGPAADVWALGVILYELLAGARPFAADGLDGLRHVVRHQEPVPLRQLAPAVPADLERLCRACLAKDPARRPASAEAVAGALDRFRPGA